MTRDQLERLPRGEYRARLDTVLRVLAAEKSARDSATDRVDPGEAERLDRRIARLSRIGEL